MPAKQQHIVGNVIYEANRDPLDGDYGPYHDAVFALYDPETGDLMDDEDDFVRVFVDDDGNHEDEIEALLELKKGDDVDLIAKKAGSRMKYFLNMSGIEDREEEEPAERPRRRASGGRRRATGGRKRATGGRSGNGRASRPERAAAPARPKKADPLEMPDDEKLEKMLDKADLLAQMMQRTYSSLAKEFALDESFNDDSIPAPSSDNLTAMTQSIFIDGVREGKWLR